MTGPSSVFVFESDIDYFTVESHEETEKVKSRTEQLKLSQQRKRSRLDEKEAEDRRTADSERHAKARKEEDEEEAAERRAKDAEKNNPTYRKRTHLVATKPITNEQKVKPFDLGSMDQICSHCKARHFKGERSQEKQFTTCCAKGKVILPEPGPFPELLEAFITKNHHKSNEFLLQIRNYNSALAFASMGAKIVTVPGKRTEGV